MLAAELVTSNCIYVYVVLSNVHAYIVLQYLSNQTPMQGIQPMYCMECVDHNSIPTHHTIL